MRFYEKTTIDYRLADYQARSERLDSEIDELETRIEVRVVVLSLYEQIKNALTDPRLSIAHHQIQRRVLRNRQMFRRLWKANA